MPGYFWRLRDFLKAKDRQPNNIIPGQDGRVYEVRDNVFGRLVLHKPFVPTLDVINEGFDFRLPKIPSELLTTAISFFRAYCNQDTQTEVMVQVFYDRESGQYEIECPVQRVRWDKIDADCTQRFNNPRYVQVLHIHSHNSMHAFFSPTDDADEKAYMLYAVVGLLLNEAPQMKLRVGSGGRFLPLPLDYIFDRPDLSKIGSYPNEWHERVHAMDSGFEYDIESMMSLMYKFWVAEASEQEIFEDAIINLDFPKPHAARMVELIKETELENFIRECGPAWEAYVSEMAE